MIWVISDTHFGHKNIVRYCNRPQDHEERMRDGLSKLVPSDLLIHVGDFALCSKELLEDYFSWIPCPAVLVEGNHDKRSRKRLKKLGWKEYVTTYTSQHDGVPVYFQHHPYSFDVPLPHCGIAVHGHVHERGTSCLMDGSTLVVCACVELWDYTPIRLEALVETRGKMMDGCSTIEERGRTKEAEDYAGNDNRTVRDREDDSST